MDLFPTSVGTRPRLACEIRPEGVVAARGESPAGTLTAVARATLRPGLVLPGLKAGNLPDRPAVVAALRRAFDGIAARGADRSRYVTVIIPDASVRVLLLDFDALPSKPAEALQVVRFRLKKLLPFDVEHALVSFQTMSTERSLLRVLAVAVPQEVLAEYEAAVLEAGMQPGVVLPSTLAALAGLDPASPSALVLNTSPAAVTTAIVRSGVLLLHRTIEVYPGEAADAADAANPLPNASISTAALAVPSFEGDRLHPSPGSLQLEGPAGTLADRYLDLGTDSSVDLSLVDRAETAEEWSRPDEFLASLEPDAIVAALNTAPDVNNRSRDLAESVSVAAAYFEDTLGTAPDLILAAGSMSAVDLDRVLFGNGLEGLRVRDLLSPDALGAGASTAVVHREPARSDHGRVERSAYATSGTATGRDSALIPPGWLTGVHGALRS